MGARRLIDEARCLAEVKGYNQSKWSSDAGFAINGQTVSRILKKGDCRLSTFITLLDTLGCDLIIRDGKE